MMKQPPKFVERIGHPGCTCFFCGEYREDSCHYFQYELDLDCGVSLTVQIGHMCQRCYGIRNRKLYFRSRDILQKSMETTERRWRKKKFSPKDKWPL